MVRRYLVNDVFDAMKKHELKVYYQPKYDATTGRLKSAEALVRWIQEDRKRHGNTGTGEKR